MLGGCLELGPNYFRDPSNFQTQKAHVCEFWLPPPSPALATASARGQGWARLVLFSISEAAESGRRAHDHDDMLLVSTRLN